MKSISNNYFYLPFGIALFILATGVVILMQIIKTKESHQTLYSITKVILLLSSIFYLLAFFGIDFTVIAPIRISFTLPSTSWYIAARIILILLFAVLFVFSFKKEVQSKMKFIWILFLIFNILNILSQTYYYLTWTKPIINYQNPLLATLLSHSYDYTIQRYLLNLFIPSLWITASILSLKRLSLNKNI